MVNGYNLSQSTTRLLCVLEGKYLLQETCYNLMENANTFIENDELQFLSFTCSIPNVTGRGFIEKVRRKLVTQDKNAQGFEEQKKNTIEDHALGSSFCPFIVAEQDVCSEICTLENEIEMADMAAAKEGKTEQVESKHQDLDFVHEMGWLLHRSNLKFRLDHLDPMLDHFPFTRFKWLMEFSIDHDWCTLVKRLLDVLFYGLVDSGKHPSSELALLEMDLLHKAVQRNHRPLVELLLRYTPAEGLDNSGTGKRQLDTKSPSYIFKPDVVGPAGLTPLHIAASTQGSENVLDALTYDPGLVGIEAWKNARDSTGLTPHDYACMQGHYSYVQLVQTKINQKSESTHVIVNIPCSHLPYSVKQRSAQIASHQTEIETVTPKQLKACE